MDDVAIILNTPSPLAEIKEDFLLCADGGYARVEGTGKKLLVIGDFDSLGRAPEGVPFLSCPTDKNYTDGEKAVRYAAEAGFRKVVLYGADGGRLDMQVANLTLLKIAFDLGLDAEIVTPKERVFYTEGSFSTECRPNKKVSVLPLGGNAEFSASDGLKYALKGLTLTPSDTVGVSNETTGERFSVALKKGGALIFVAT